MAFSVSYQIQAIDQFSKVAKTVADSAKHAAETIGNINLSSASSFQKFSDAVGYSMIKAEYAFAPLSRKLKDMGGSIKSFGKDYSTYVTAPLVLAGGYALKVGGDFEYSMNRVQAMIGGNVVDMSKLKNAALDMGAKTSYSANEAAIAMETMSHSMKNAKDIVGAMPFVAQLAEATQIDLAKAGEILSNIMAGYKLKASEIPRVNDILVKSFIDTRMDIEALGQAFKMAGPQASAMGIKFEDMAAILGELNKLGFGNAGAIMKASVTKMSKLSNDAKKAFVHLKIKKSDVFDSEGHLKSFVGLLETMEKQGAKSGDIMRIFGAKAGAGISALVENGTSNLVEMRNKLLAESQGMAERLSKANDKSFKENLERAHNAIMNLGVAIADSGLLEGFTKLVEHATNFINRLSKANPEMLKIAGIFGLVAAAVGPVIVGIGFMTVGFGALAGALGVTAGALWAVAAPVLIGVAALTILGVAVYEVWKHLDDLKALMKDNFIYKFFSKVNNAKLTGPVADFGDKIDAMLKPSKPDTKQYERLFGSVKNFGEKVLFAPSITKSIVENQSPSNENALNKFMGNLDINIRDKGRNVESTKLVTNGFLDLGVIGIGN